MKKRFFLVGAICSLIFVSCTSFSLQLRPAEFRWSNGSERNSGMVTISVQPTWEKSGPGNGNGNGNGNGEGQNKYDGIRVFSVVFHNNTDRAVQIIWDKSSLRYNGGSYAPFVEGQKYDNPSSYMKATVIPPRGTVKKNIYSSQQQYFDPGKFGGWKMRPILADNAVLVFCVQSWDMEDYYTISID